MAATKKPAADPKAKQNDDDTATEKVADVDTSESAPAGYVTIERDGQTALVDAKSVPELAVQGWKPAK